MDEKKYNVAVSYASEQRSYVERFVKRLHSLKLQVYYDRDEQAQMVGKILDQELHKIYIQQSRHCVLFLSNEYIKKPVTRYESQIILSETLFKDGFMYIFKFDDVTLPGLNRNFVYINMSWNFTQTGRQPKHSYNCGLTIPFCCSSKLGIYLENQARISGFTGGATPAISMLIKDMCNGAPKTAAISWRIGESWLI